MLFIMRHNLTTPDAQSDALWTLSYLSDGSDKRIQAIVDWQVAPQAIAALETNTSALMAPALRVLGNIVTGNAEQTQAVLDAGILGVILPLLEHTRVCTLLQYTFACSPIQPLTRICFRLLPQKTLRKEATWLLSNIAAGTSAQKMEIFERPKIVAALVDMAQSATWEVRKEAVWAVSNLFDGATPRQVATLVELDAIEAMADILDLTDAGMVLVALDAIEHILSTGKTHGKSYHVFFEECDGITKLEQLQHHTNDKIYAKAVEIIEEFYGCEEAEEDENLAPSFGQDGNFAFGTSSPSKNLFGSPSPSTAAPSQSPAAKFDFGFGGLNSSNVTHPSFNTGS